MRIFISGGCKNGKSTYAQKIAVSQKKTDLPLYYVATMKPMDSEDMERIKRHIKEREGQSFDTLEQPFHILEVLKKGNKKGSFLLDSTTALLANEMFHKDSINIKAAENIGEDLNVLLSEIEDIVIVSDYIYSDALFYSRETKEYQKGLAYLDKICVSNCDVVIEICYGNVIFHKGMIENSMDWSHT